MQYYKTILHNIRELRVSALARETQKGFGQSLSRKPFPKIFSTGISSISSPFAVLVLPQVYHERLISRIKSDLLRQESTFLIYFDPQLFWSKYIGAD